MVSTTEVKASSLISASSWSAVVPALATTTSTGPCAASAILKASSTAAASLTSHLATVSPSISSPERDVTVTASPAAANRRAIASPIPRLPPVTRTDRLMIYLRGQRAVSRQSVWQTWAGPLIRSLRA